MHETARQSPGKSPSRALQAPAAGRSLVPAGYRPLDDVDARALVPGTELYTPHPSAGQTPGGWGLAAVRVERVRESACGDDKDDPQPCAVVDVALAGRSLTFAPEDLLCRKRRGAIGS